MEAGAVVEEAWLPPAAGLMVGVSRTIREDSTHAWEHMVIRAEPEGVIFEAAPSGQPPVRFPALEVNDTLARFANPEHDFPQRIRYVRQGEDSLTAVVSGMVRGRDRRIEFHYLRASCLGP